MVFGALTRVWMLLNANSNVMRITIMNTSMWQTFHLYVFCLTTPRAAAAALCLFDLCLPVVTTFTSVLQSKPRLPRHPLVLLCIIYICYQYPMFSDAPWNVIHKIHGTWYHTSECCTKNLILLVALINAMSWNILLLQIKPSINLVTQTTALM